jgi:hypothetical protein
MAQFIMGEYFQAINKKLKGPNLSFLMSKETGKNYVAKHHSREPLAVADD